MLSNVKVEYNFIKNDSEYYVIVIYKIFCPGT